MSSKAPAAAAILEGSGLVQGYMRYAVGTRSVRELLGLWWEIVRWRPEVLVYLAAPRGVKTAQRDEAFFRMCGVRRMVGVPLTEGMQRNYYGAATGGKDHAMGDGHLEPEAGRLARCIGELAEAEDIADPGRLSDPASWDLHLSAEERERAAQAIGRGGAGGGVDCGERGDEGAGEGLGQGELAGAAGEDGGGVSGAGAAAAGSGGGERGE